MRLSASQADAYHSAEPVHGVRPVPGAVPADCISMVPLTGEPWVGPLGGRPALPERHH